MQWSPPPVVLEGDLARLEPLALDHAEDLLPAGRDAEVWRYLPMPVPRDIEDIRRLIDDALAARAAGRQLPFAIIARNEGRAVGSTRYLDMQPANRGLEIGWTWIGKRRQRSGINTECKLLLLRHAFETLGAQRVQFKTDLRNEGSQRALARIGASREGVLRKHMLLWNGHFRDSVYFSILREEWPRVAEHLQALLKR